MLLRGVKFAPPALDRADIEATKGRANRSGRSHGSAPLRGRNGNDRGRGSISYAPDPRPNPFALHVPPGYAPPSAGANYYGGAPRPYPAEWRPYQSNSQSYPQGTHNHYAEVAHQYNSQGQSNHDGRTQGQSYGYGPSPLPPPPHGRNFYR